MKTVYTTTLTGEALRRGIAVEVIDPATPIFTLKHGSREVRCYNSLTDRVGAVSFYLADNKHCANKFLSHHGFSVPRQICFTTVSAARDFLRKIGCIVVKPCAQWGGRGVSVAVRTTAELNGALRRARKFGETVLLEECVRGSDLRVIVVDGRAIAAIKRTPAQICGNGQDTIKKLVAARNRAAAKTDPSNKIPVDSETRRTLRDAGLDWGSIPPAGRAVAVRRTTNYHTGGTVEDISDNIPPALAAIAQKVAGLFKIGLMGIDFLVDEHSGKQWIIEASPDLAISPPEGGRVAKYFLDYLFPETKK
ncbi:MAG: hypothetical protein PHC61_18525 [Chitinivibrionales bacterium]|nr:hypothetical protein [Chitinivibrionales bacterium]